MILVLTFRELCDKIKIYRLLAKRKPALGEGGYENSFRLAPRATSLGEGCNEDSFHRKRSPVRLPLEGAGAVGD